MLANVAARTDKELIKKETESCLRYDGEILQSVYTVCSFRTCAFPGQNVDMIPGARLAQ